MSKNGPSVEIRKRRLQQIKEMLLENEERFLQALEADLGKSNMEGYTSELAVLLNELDHTLRKLKKWTKPKKIYEWKIGYVTQIVKRPVPYGNILIISPWNYPLQLALLPAINAIAAGNSVTIKPSEHTPATSQLLKELIASRFTEQEIQVCVGGTKVAQDLISRGFDFLIFTGSVEVGKKVYEQAAGTLTPVILELGGKNACILDETAFTEENIREIVWGKFLNAGQTCVAPDTLFVPESIYDNVVEMVSHVIVDFYGEKPEESPDFGRIVHDQHFQKVAAYLSEGTIAYGGKMNRTERFIAPTIVVDMDASSDVMKEEIFGPVLPIVSYTQLKDLLASDLIQKDALTTYLFTNEMEQIELVRQEIKGMVSINKVIHHAGSSRVPFGGTGRSGFGAYHGETGFTACSFVQTDYRALTYKYLREKHPPYTKKAFGWVKRLRRWLF